MTLDGRVDIRAYCQDIQTSGGVNNTSGIYKLQYIIADALHNTIYNSDTTIVFRQVQPPNNGEPVLLVYDRHNYRTASPFYYWVTNRIVNNQVVDRYWNTKQKNFQIGFWPIRLIIQLPVFFFQMFKLKTMCVWLQLSIDAKQFMNIIYHNESSKQDNIYDKPIYPPNYIKKIFVSFVVNQINLYKQSRSQL